MQTKIVMSLAPFWRIMARQFNADDKAHGCEIEFSDLLRGDLREEQSDVHLERFSVRAIETPEKL